MDTIFTLGDETNEKLRINLDDLYEQKQKYDTNTVIIYNRILARIHNRIQTISRIHKEDHYCWYVIPEMMIGIPNYDHEGCVAYCIDELKDNGFIIRYTHPNLLLISWNHWIPGYVRNELKKKTGLNIDGRGNKIINKKNGEINDSNFNTTSKFSSNNNNNNNNNNINYKKIDSYKPSGIYNKDLFKNIHDKSSNK